MGGGYEEGEFHPWEGNLVRTAWGDKDSWKHLPCAGTDWGVHPLEYLWSYCRAFSWYTLYTTSADARFARELWYTTYIKLSLPQSSNLKILTDDLQFKNVLSVWVPHQLTDSNKMERVKCCRALIQLFNEHGFEFLGSHMFVQDETWVLWDLKSRREVWIPQDGQKPTTPQPKLTKRDTMVLMGFTCCPKRFSVAILPPGTTADRNVMFQYLKDTGHRFNNLKKNKIKLGELMLMWDNSKHHSAHETQAFIVHRDTQPVKQPAYSPDLNLCDRFLFRKIKHRLKGYDFGGHEYVKDCMQRVVRSLPEDELFQQLKKLRDHCQPIIEAGGDYVTWLYSYLNVFINFWVLLVQSKSFQLNTCHITNSKRQTKVLIWQ